MAHSGWARPFGDFNHRWLSALFRPMPPSRTCSTGRGWAIHSTPRHGYPDGVLTASLLLDILGQPTAADIALVLGILAMLAAAATGLADYTDTDGAARVRATVHGP